MNDQQQLNPLLHKIRIPGETIRLPSRGIFYTPGVLIDDVINGEIHVYPMTTIDELILKSPDKIMSGDAIAEIFSRCVPQVLNTKRLLAKDVDFILITLKKIVW
jgi:hypothetical protein